jgi:trimethylguanosine synthase
VTPEPVAVRIAADLANQSNPSKKTLVDLFAGAGGNVIAFALQDNRWERIVAVEKDPATLACAQHNAAVYGVPDGAITWVLGDCFDYLAAAKEDGGSEVDEELRIDGATTTLFASPPWGGVSYRDHDVFDLSLMRPYNLEELSRACSPWEYTLYLPRTSDLRQIAKLAPQGQKIEVVQYCMEGASKALVAYVPESEADRQKKG